MGGTNRAKLARDQTTCKLIQNEIKAVAKAVKTSNVCQVLDEFKGSGQIADATKKGKNQSINLIFDKEGKDVSDTNDIVEFYESLYK